MAYVRIEYRLKLNSAPAYGKWNIYSKAWFQTSTPVPSSTVKNLLQRMFSGHPGAGTTPQWHSSSPFVGGAGAGQLTKWEWSGTALTSRVDYPVTPLSYSDTPSRFYPAQIAVAFGYRAPITGNPQKGRSRFWVGPIAISNANVSDVPGLGVRLTPGAVDTAAACFKSCVQLLHAEGWDLVVKSGTGGGTTFAVANEVYVDDVFDVMRSRRTYTAYQKRLTV